MHETQERQRAGTALLLFCMFPPHLAVCTQVATGVNTDMPGSREAGKEKSKLQQRVCACLPVLLGQQLSAPLQGSCVNKNAPFFPDFL